MLGFYKPGTVRSLHAVLQYRCSTALRSVILGIFEPHRAIEVQLGVDLECYPAVTDVDTLGSLYPLCHIRAVEYADGRMKRTSFVAASLGRVCRESGRRQFGSVHCWSPLNLSSCNRNCDSHEQSVEICEPRSSGLYEQYEYRGPESLGGVRETRDTRMRS